MPPSSSLILTLVLGCATNRMPRPDGSAGDAAGEVRGVGVATATGEASADSAATATATATGVTPGETTVLTVAPDAVSADCTLASPCPLATAQARVRELRGKVAGDIVVSLRGGRYSLSAAWRLGPEDSGSSGQRVIYQAYPGERPELVGSHRITGFERVDPGRNVWRAPVPAGSVGRQLYVDGVRAERTHTARGSLPFTPTARGLATVNADRSFLGWAARPGIEVMQDNQWKHLRCPVVAIEATTDTTPAVNSYQPRVYPPASPGGTTLVIEPRCWRNNMLAVPRPGYPFNGSGLPHLENVSWIENVFELLGPPGRFYLDTRESFVYYVPRPGEDLTTADVELPFLQTLLAVVGTPGHLAPRNDDDPGAVYSAGWQRLAGRGRGDLGDDVHATQSPLATLGFTFTGTGFDLLGEVNTDQGELEIALHRAGDGALLQSETVSARAPALLAQQVVYSLAGLPRDSYRLTLKKAAADASWLVIDGFVVTPEPLAPVHDLAFRGLTFAYSTWVLPSEHGYVDNQAGILWDPLTHAPTRIPAAVVIGRGLRIELTGNRFSHLGGAGVELVDGTRESSVVGNRLGDISGGGLLVGDVDDYYLADHFSSGPSRMTAGIEARNNVVTDTGIDYHDTVGIWIGNSRSTTVAHNLVAHTSYTGISVGWGWGWGADCEKQLRSNTSLCRRGTTYSGGNRIVANRIYDVMRTLVDGGPIYTLGAQAVTGGVAPTVAGNVVSNAASCFHMLYHDEGSAFWQTYDNVVYNTGCHWLGIWMPTAQQNQIGVQGPNHSDNPQRWSDNGSQNQVTQARLLTLEAWPAEVQKIADEAGPEPPFRALLPAATTVINDGDAALRYSSDAANRQWSTSTVRGLGDIGDDVHYATADGATAQLTFESTGVEVIGEKNLDQGLVEIFLDGTSRGTVDTRAPARLTRQVLFSARGLSAGRHTIKVVKRSGQYATLDGFLLAEPVSPITGDQPASP